MVDNAQTDTFYCNKINSQAATEAIKAPSQICACWGQVAAAPFFLRAIRARGA
jgi:hypothetical protein